MKNVETLIVKNIIDGPSFKVAIVEDDIVSKIQKKMPTMSFGGTTYYYSAQKITSSHRRTKWYKNTKQNNKVDRSNQNWADIDTNEWLINIF